MTISQYDSAVRSFPIYNIPYGTMLKRLFESTFIPFDILLFTIFITPSLVFAGCLLLGAERALANDAFWTWKDCGQLLFSILVSLRNLIRPKADGRSTRRSKVVLVLIDLGSTRQILHLLCRILTPLYMSIPTERTSLRGIKVGTGAPKIVAVSGEGRGGGVERQGVSGSEQSVPQAGTSSASPIRVVSANLPVGGPAGPSYNSESNDVPGSGPPPTIPVAAVTEVQGEAINVHQSHIPNHNTRQNTLQGKESNSSTSPTRCQGKTCSEPQLKDSKLNSGGHETGQSSADENTLTTPGQHYRRRHLACSPISPSATSLPQTSKSIESGSSDVMTTSIAASGQTPSPGSRGLWQPIAGHQRTGDGVAQRSNLIGRLDLANGHAVRSEASHLSSHTSLHSNLPGVSTTSPQNDTLEYDSLIIFDDEEDKPPTSTASSSPSTSESRTSRRSSWSPFAGAPMDAGAALGIAHKDAAHHSSRSKSFPDTNPSPPFSPTTWHRNASLPKPRNPPFGHSPEPSYFTGSRTLPLPNPDPSPRNQAPDIFDHRQKRHPQHLRQDDNGSIGDHSHELSDSSAASSPTSPGERHSNSQSKKLVDEHGQSLIFQDTSQEDATETKRPSQHDDTDGPAQVNSRSLDDNLSTPATASKDRQSAPSNPSGPFTFGAFGSPDHPICSSILAPGTKTTQGNAYESSKSSQALIPPQSTQHGRGSRDTLGHGDDSSSPLQAFKPPKPISFAEESSTSVDDNHPSSPTPRALPSPASAASTEQVIPSSPAPKSEQPVQPTTPGEAPTTDDTDAIDPPNTNLPLTSSSTLMINHFKAVNDWCKTEVKERLKDQEQKLEDFLDALNSRWGPLAQEDLNVLLRRLGELIAETRKNSKR